MLWVGVFFNRSAIERDIWRMEERSSDVGSSFVVIGKGVAGAAQGSNFQCSFVGPISWTLVAQKGQSLTYQLSGNIMGTLWNGHFVTGATSEAIYSRNGHVSLGIGHVRIGSGPTFAPEPGTLGLLGTGILRSYEGIAAESLFEPSR